MDGRKFEIETWMDYIMLGTLVLIYWLIWM